MSAAVIHALTPGDHFSPLTGSAIPTVVHGLAASAAAAGCDRHGVLLDRSTMHPRYPSADVVEYDGFPFPSRAARVADAVASRVGLPRRAALRSFAPLATAVARREPSVVVAHNAPALTTLLHGGRHAVVLYAHNDLFRSMSRGEAARCAERAAAIVCVSRDLAARMAGRLPDGLADRIRVVDNGVDVEQFHPVPRPESERLRVMFLGRTIPEKGPDVLIEAAALLQRDDVEIAVVGSYGFDRGAELTPYERGLRDRAEAAGLHVSFEPFVDRLALPALLATADVFVAPSRWAEPSGLTIGEAMATGLPVVASDIGGIPDVLGDAGVLVTPDAPSELALTLEALADDPALRAELGARARARAEQRSWSHSWRQFQAVLDRL